MVEGGTKNVVLEQDGGENYNFFLQQLFERENRDLDAVVIRELLDLVAHSDRVLSSPGGSLLLAGRSGTNPMNGLPACIYKLVNTSFFKSFVATSFVKFHQHTLALTFK